MKFGDELKEALAKGEFLDCTKYGKRPFWIVLRNVAIADIQGIYPHSIDSDSAVPIYYQILKEHEDMLPNFLKIRLGNKQERYRVVNRNLFTSNAFHTEGLANQPGIYAKKQVNESKKGYRIVYKGGL